MHYTLLLDDGTVVETTKQDPFSYLHGAGNIVPGLERALEGCRVGDRLAATVDPEDGYGAVNPGLIRRIARADLPREARLEPGASFLAEIEDGTRLRAWVIALDGKDLVVSFNHPLAGETLHFAVEVLDIRNAQPSELVQRRAERSHR